MNEELKDKVVSGIKTLLISSISIQLISWLATILTARFLTPSDYGVVSLFEAVFPYIFLISNFGVGWWVESHKVLSDEERRTASTLSLLLGAISSVCVFYFSGNIAVYLGDPTIQNLVQIVSPIFFLRALQIVPEADLKRTFRFKIIGRLNVVTVIFRSVLQFVLAFKGFGYWALIAGTMLREIVFALYLNLKAPSTTKFILSKNVLRGIFKFGLFTSFSAFAWIVFSTTDNIVVGKILGKESLGFYAMAFMLGDIIASKFNPVILPILTPLFSNLQDQQSELRKVFYDSQKVMIYPVLVANTYLAILAPLVVPILFGDKWVGLEQILRSASWIGIVRSLTCNWNSLFISMKKPSKLFPLNIINALFLPIAFYFGCLNYGLTGVIASWLIFYPLISLGFFIFKILPVIGGGIAEFLRDQRGLILTAVLNILATVCAYALSGFELIYLTIFTAFLNILIFYLLDAKDLLRRYGTQIKTNT